MTFDGENLTEGELSVHSKAICQCISILCKAADKLNVDRDSYLAASASTLSDIFELGTFEYYEVEK